MEILINLKTICSDHNLNEKKLLTLLFFLLIEFNFLFYIYKYDTLYIYSIVNLNFLVFRNNELSLKKFIYYVKISVLSEIFH